MQRSQKRQRAEVAGSLPEPKRQREKAVKHSSSVWDAQKANIKRIFLVEDETLDVVRQHMRDHHGFSARYVVDFVNQVLVVLLEPPKGATSVEKRCTNLISAPNPSAPNVSGSRNALFCSFSVHDQILKSKAARLSTKNKSVNGVGEKH